MYVYMYTYIYTILFTVYSLFDQFEFKQFTLFYLVNQYLQNIYLCGEKYIYTCFYHKTTNSCKYVFYYFLFS